MAFPGATADREAADHVLLGAPLDRSTSFQPGARFGPDRVRRYARGFEDYDHHTGTRFTACSVHDGGDIEPWEPPEEYVTHLAGVLGDIHREGAVPLLVGGEHTVTVAGVRAVEPDTVVVCDAHLDLKETLRGDPWSHATVTRRALETADRVVVLGARAGSETEWGRAEAEDVTVVPPDAVADWVTDCVPDELGRTYLSVDIDAADPAVAPGTGTPEPFGLDGKALHGVVRQLAPHASAFDIVEVTDRDDGQAALLAAKLLRAFVFEHSAD